MDFHFHTKQKDYHFHLAVHGQKIISTLTSLGNGFQSGTQLWENHQGHLKALRGGSGRNKFILNVAGNCLSCGKDVYCNAKTVWENGKLIDFSYEVDGSPLTQCPECNERMGLTHTETLGFD